MKKLLTILLSVLMVMSLAACSSSSSNSDSTADDTADTTDDTDDSSEAADTPTAKDDYYSFHEAAVDSEVEVLMYVQGHQAYWEDNGQGVMTIYGNDGIGGYFVYNGKIDKEQADAIEEGTLVKVTGVKSEWSGEVEITDATIEVYPSCEEKVFDVLDVTDVMNDTETLTECMNQKVAINGLEVVEVTKKDSESDPDLYIECKLGELTVNLCVENYLTGPDTDVYQAAESLEAGNVIDVEGFLYWYEGANPHVTSITLVG